MKKLLAFLALLPLACQSSMPTTNEAATAPPHATLQVLDGVEGRLRQLPKTVIDYDRSLLNDNEKQVVAKLIEATKAIDELYWKSIDRPKTAHWLAAYELVRGVLTPNPTAIGVFEIFLMYSTFRPISDTLPSFAPVIPVSDT